MGFTYDAIVAIAEAAAAKRTGARGLRSIVENLLLDAFYNLPRSGHNAILVDADAVLGKGPVHLFSQDEISVPKEQVIVPSAMAHRVTKSRATRGDGRGGDKSSDEDSGGVRKVHAAGSA